MSCCGDRIKVRRPGIRPLEESKPALLSARLVLAGPARVGKTSLVQSLQGEYTGLIAPTIGVDVNISCLGGSRLLIYDVSGSPHFASVACAYYRMSDLFFLVFDLSDRISFQQVADFRARTSALRPGAFSWLVGNKRDLKRVVDRQEAEGLAESWGIPYREVSAKDGQSVKDLFAEAAEKLRKPLSIENR